ncbi:MAG: hypothetical protein QF596_04570 [Acidimicrobiales bacterium]|jgi:hypothetical protein|nr:hypothetical protein [Acidimicrobiales bacterium]HJM29227.1 hypothetical protein [Acidimicrobiales bacterium]
MIDKLHLFQIVAGISWDPEIRGALTVLVGSAVLFGSVWLILNTNLGSRLGTMIALTGFFGWMMIMGIVWWIYGIGLKGDSPTWEPKEIIYGDLGESETDVKKLGSGKIKVTEASEIVDIYCPGLVDATVDVQRARYVEDNVDLKLDYDAPQPYCTESIGEKLAVDEETLADTTMEGNERLLADAEQNGIEDSRILTEEQLSEEIAKVINDQEIKLSQLTLSGLAALSGEIIDDARSDGLLDFNDWNLLSTSSAGEAIASADAFLKSDSDSPFFNRSSDDFFVLNTFQKGGKPKRSSDSVIDRVANEIRNTIIFWHPTNRVVVTVAPTIDKEPIAGQAPPFPEIDPAAQKVSVVMERNLGTLRLPAALTTIGSALAFFGLCFMLSQRERELQRRTEDWESSTAT